MQLILALTLNFVGGCLKQMIDTGHDRTANCMPNRVVILPRLTLAAYDSRLEALLNERVRRPTDVEVRPAYN